MRLNRAPAVFVARLGSCRSSRLTQIIHHRLNRADGGRTEAGPDTASPSADAPPAPEPEEPGKPGAPGTPGEAQDGRYLVAAGLRMDPRARRAWRDGHELELTRTEFGLLELLVRNAGIVLDHSTIYDRIWHYDFGPDSKNLAVYIGYLRRKLEEDGEARLIQTVRGVGYAARAPADGGGVAP